MQIIDNLRIVTLSIVVVKKSRTSWSAANFAGSSKVTALQKIYMAKLLWTDARELLGKRSK